MDGVVARQVQKRGVGAAQSRAASGPRTAGAFIERAADQEASFGTREESERDVLQFVHQEEKKRKEQKRKKERKTPKAKQ